MIFHLIGDWTNDKKFQIKATLRLIILIMARRIKVNAKVP